MSEADDDLAGLDTAADIGLGVVGGVVALLDLEGDLIGAAVFRAAEGADRAGDRGIEVRTRAGDDPGGEGGGVEFVLGVEDQGRVHGTNPLIRGVSAVQEVEEMTADRIVVGLDLDAAAVDGEVIPVKEH